MKTPKSFVPKTPPAPKFAMPARVGSQFVARPVGGGRIPVAEHVAMDPQTAAHAKARMNMGM